MLLPTTTINTNGTGTPVTGLGRLSEALILLDCSGVPTGGTPTLDIYVQTTCDQGGNWRDFAHTQVTNAVVKRYVQLSGKTAGATALLAANDGSLTGETVVQGPWGDQLRLKWVFAAGGSTGTYTLTAHITGKP
jgi:hypothetical protein